MATSPSSVPLSFAHLAALEVGPPDLIDMLAEAGFASTSVRMRRTAPGTPEYPLTDPVIRRATKERIAATGVTVLYTEMVALSRSLDPRDLRAMFEAAADVGAARVVTGGDDEDFAIVAEKLASVCELAHSFGMLVEIEFMPFRGVKSLSDAVRVLEMADQPNALIMVDALHFYRSNSKLSELKELDPRLIGSFQLCDAPAAPPSDLTYEARNARLLTGKGGLDVNAIMDALPDDVPLGVEVPLALEFPHLSALERAKLTVSETRAFLESRARRDA
jgi:sugar phosphate isomerase/epimerase